MKVICDLYSNFGAIWLHENIRGKRTRYIGSVIYRDKFRITVIMTLNIQMFSILGKVDLF